MPMWVLCILYVVGATYVAYCYAETASQLYEKLKNNQLRRTPIRIITYALFLLVSPIAITGILIDDALRGWFK